MMNWTVLSDNRSTGCHLEPEHGLSILLETERHRVLMDTGASDLFMRNAERMGVDLGNIDFVFISHGHSDHAGGLRSFLDFNKTARVIVSPHALGREFFSKRKGLHSITAMWPEQWEERRIEVERTCEVAEGLRVMANIPHVHPMPRGNGHLFVKDEQGACVPDDFRHELALWADGLLFTGCAHNGLENILAACPWPVHTVVGGFHLIDGFEQEADVEALGHRLKEKYPQTQFYTSHCTGDGAFEILKKVMGNQLSSFSIS